MSQKISASDGPQSQFGTNFNRSLKHSTVLDGKLKRIEVYYCDREWRYVTKPGLQLTSGLVSNRLVPHRRLTNLFYSNVYSPGLNGKVEYKPRIPCANLVLEKVWPLKSKDRDGVRRLWSVNERGWRTSRKISRDNLNKTHDRSSPSL